MDLISSELWCVPAPSQSIGLLDSQLIWLAPTLATHLADVGIASLHGSSYTLIEFVHRGKVSIDSNNELRGTKINHMASQPQGIVHKYPTTRLIAHADPCSATGVLRSTKF